MVTYYQWPIKSWPGLHRPGTRGVRKGKRPRKSKKEPLEDEMKRWEAWKTLIELAREEKAGREKDTSHEKKRGYYKTGRKQRAAPKQDNPEDLEQDNLVEHEDMKRKPRKFDL